MVEDAGDTLHGQRNALDSGYVLDADADYSNPVNQPLRWLAEGRDASATIDSAFGGFGKNDGDNEISVIHVSDGDPSVHGVLGTEAPNLFHEGWRWFYTQQHGDTRPTRSSRPAESRFPSNAAWAAIERKEPRARPGRRALGSSVGRLPTPAP